jgi:hypothetical protein
MSKRRYVMSRSHSDDYTSDYGTRERWQHSAHELVSTELRGILAMRSLEECALDRWLMVQAISRAEHLAGLKLREDYITGGVPLVANRVYDGVRGPTPGAAWQSPAERRTEGAERAYRRWRGAIEHLGQRGAVVAIAVCCEDGKLAWHRRAELRDILANLQKYYGIPELG